MRASHALLLGVWLLAAGKSVGQEAPPSRSFDARVAFNAGFEVEPSPAQRRAERALPDGARGIAVSYDRTSGVARNVRRHSGYLTEASADDSRAIVLEFVNAKRELLGLTSDDLQHYETADAVFSRVTGATHNEPASRR